MRPGSAETAVPPPPALARIGLNRAIIQGYIFRKQVSDCPRCQVAAQSCEGVILAGAVLALEAANRLRGIKKLALYEAPFIVDDSRGTTEGDWVRIGAAVAADRRSDAVKLFLKAVGAPGFFIALMRLLPMWSRLKAVAHTLPYDGAIVKDHQRGKALPASQWASVTVPALVMDGGKSPVWMRHANRSLASILPNAQYRTLKGQTHMLKPKAHAPMLVEFFKD